MHVQPLLLVTQKWPGGDSVSGGGGSAKRGSSAQRDRGSVEAVAAQQRNIGGGSSVSGGGGSAKHGGGAQHDSSSAVATVELHWLR